MGAAVQAGSREYGDTCTALSTLETQYLGIKPDGGEETMSKTVASPLPAHERGTLGSAFQTNRRESFYQRDLEEKMVHKVTMDTVRIITSSVSGMTNVSAPHPATHPLGWRAAAGGSCLHCPGSGRLVHVPSSAPSLLSFPLPGVRGALIFQSPELSSFKTKFCDGEPEPPDASTAPGTY